MASPATPSRSPATPDPYHSAVSTPNTPGSWRHPAMDIVSKRRAQTTFTDASFNTLIRNSVALAASFLLFAVLSRLDTITALTSHVPPALATWFFYVVWTIRFLFIFNVGDCLYRLLRPVDDFADIALTPDQRKLLGLNPNTPLSASAAAETFVTPPRYAKSNPSSRSGSPALGFTPNLPTGSPTLQRKAAGTPPPATPSPIRRLQRSSSFSGGTGFGTPTSASPSKGNASLTPGGRWGYERSILPRKGDALRFSPSRSLFGTPR